MPGKEESIERASDRIFGISSLEAASFSSSAQSMRIHMQTKVAGTFINLTLLPLRPYLWLGPSCTTKADRYVSWPLRKPFFSSMAETIILARLLLCLHNRHIQGALSSIMQKEFRRGGGTALAPRRNSSPKTTNHRVAPLARPDQPAIRIDRHAPRKSRQ